MPTYHARMSWSPASHVTTPVSNESNQGRIVKKTVINLLLYYSRRWGPAVPRSGGGGKTLPQPMQGIFQSLLRCVQFVQRHPPSVCASSGSARAHPSPCAAGFGLGNPCRSRFVQVHTRSALSVGTADFSKIVRYSGRESRSAMSKHCTSRQPALPISVSTLSSSLGRSLYV